MTEYVVVKPGYFVENKYPVFKSAGDIVNFDPVQAKYKLLSGDIRLRASQNEPPILVAGKTYYGIGAPTSDYDVIGSWIDQITGSSYINTGSGWSIYKLTVLAGSSTPAPTPVVPGQVTGLGSSVVTTNTVALFWSAPTTGDPASDFIIEFRVAGASVWQSVDTASTTISGIVTGLNSGTNYEFRVTAKNSVGNGTPSSAYAVATLAIVTPPQSSVSTPGGGSGNKADHRDSNNAYLVAFAA